MTTTAAGPRGHGEGGIVPLVEAHEAHGVFAHDAARDDFDVDAGISGSSAS